MSSSKPAKSNIRSSSSDQAKVYASQRVPYESNIYNTVLEHHAATGGQFGVLLDCGCRPGNATRDVALSFDQAVGLDAGPAMIAAARELGGKTKSGSDIRYELSLAEEISQAEGLQPGPEDLLTVAMAVSSLRISLTGNNRILHAHWFDMNKFRAEAAKLVKPGGTVAIWTRGKLIHCIQVCQLQIVL
jgi:SAM-dependent methyltransferase